MNPGFVEALLRSITPLDDMLRSATADTEKGMPHIDAAFRSV